jgi:hypothetical protein
MKSFLIVLMSACICTTIKAQTDTVVANKTDTTVEKPDTISIAGILITKSKKNKEQVIIELGRKEHHKISNVSTDWWLFDIGFSNYIDKTNYNTTSTYLVNKPGTPALGQDDFNLRAGKSINVNIWFFMQRLNLIKHYVNLKYGLGLELNNYRYNSNISYRQDGTIPYSNPSTFANSPFIFRDSISFTKNKLAADYVTVPIMLNIDSDPRDPGSHFNFSFGVSGGYLYSQRNKQISAERGKQKYKGDLDINPFKLAYVADIGLGPIHLYGSYSPTSFYKNTLDMRPYTIGIRLSNR